MLYSSTFDCHTSFSQRLCVIGLIVAAAATASCVAVAKATDDARRVFSDWGNNSTATATALLSVLLRLAVGYTMDVMYFAWLSNPVEIDRAIQLPQFRLRRTIKKDCSQNYTGGRPSECDAVSFVLEIWQRWVYTVFRKKTPTHIFFHISTNYLWI